MDWRCQAGSPGWQNTACIVHTATTNGCTYQSPATPDAGLATLTGKNGTTVQKNGC